MLERERERLRSVVSHSRHRSANEEFISVSTRRGRASGEIISYSLIVDEGGDALQSCVRSCAFIVEPIVFADTMAEHTSASDSLIRRPSRDFVALIYGRKSRRDYYSKILHCRKHSRLLADIARARVFITADLARYH